MIVKATSNKLDDVLPESRKEILTIILFVLLVLLCINLFTMYLGAKNKLTKNQVKQVALSYAYERCLAQHNPKINCSSLHIMEPEKTVGFVYHYVKQPSWRVTFVTDETGPDGFNTTVYIAPDGTLLPGHQLNI